MQIPRIRIYVWAQFELQLLASRSLCTGVCHVDGMRCGFRPIPSHPHTHFFLLTANHDCMQNLTRPVQTKVGTWSYGLASACN